MEKETETISFDVKDKNIYGVQSYDGNELMAIISGYDLHIAFNMRLINSLSDAENCANALADVFYELLMEELISKKSEVTQPTSS
ncbi:hypothetical protein POZ03_16710 [Bacteroides uniformis]|uniref:hypothetical protein n=1 Tax=Bacteroides uniformis TaxID=820 RepID=UPI00233ED920|nr:hypothetical protein [Bacteroides uniformis]MDC1812102.1 hypothetical protein [Bacteroides uniformis]